MTDETRSRHRNGYRAGLGLLLIAFGLFFLLAPAFNIHIGYYTWPLVILIPGVVLILIAFTAGGRIGEPLMIFGSIATMLGLLFLYQNTTHHWESWAYAWALIFPTSIGLGQMAYGFLKKQADIARSGRRLAMLGITIFLVGLLVFELIIGISGYRIHRLGWALLLILLGIILLMPNILALRRKQKLADDEN